VVKFVLPDKEPVEEVKKDEPKKEGEDVIEVEAD